jgi:hypothetical protein
MKRAKRPLKFALVLSAFSILLTEEYVVSCVSGHLLKLLTYTEPTVKTTKQSTTMPLFSRREPEAEAAPEPQPVVEEHPKRHGFFGRRDASPTPSQRTSATTNTSLSSMTYHTTPDGGPVGGSGGHSIFRRSTDASSGKHGILHRTFGNGNSATEMDPSIVAARERVMSAEAAEREADRALEEARRSVREAREHVRRLEEEAREEARRAKIKQYHAREVSKRGKALGRTLYPHPSLHRHCIVC